MIKYKIHAKYTKRNSYQIHSLKTDYFENQKEHSVVYGFLVRQIRSEFS